MKLFRVLSLLVLAFGLSGCLSEGSSDSSALPSDLVPADSRPSTSSEGLPGYMATPNAIVLNVDPTSGDVDIQAPPNTFQAFNGDNSALVVSIFHAQETDVGELYAAPKENDTLPAQYDGSDYPSSDGSFKTSISMPVPKAIVIALGQKPNSDDVTIIDRDDTTHPMFAIYIPVPSITGTTYVPLSTVLADFMTWWKNHVPGATF